MLHFALWKKLLIALLVATGVVYAAPNLLTGDNFSSKKINLGLDLQGGAHLLMRADLPAIVAERMNDMAENLRLSMREERVRFRHLKAHSDMVTFAIRAPDDLPATRMLVQRLNEGLNGGLEIIIADLDFTLRFNAAGLQTLSTQIIEQSIEIVRRRLDPEGTKEPIIQRQGQDRILIQLPGIDDPSRIKKLLGQTAKLTFQLVDRRSTADEARRIGRAPPGSQLLPSYVQGEGDYVVEKRVIVSGEMLDNASPGFDQNNRPAVNFQLNAEGGRRFGRTTAENIGRPFAIILDGTVVSAPVIQAQIFSNGQITGDFSVQETQDLALILRAGALPAPLITLEERSVGPGLGADSVAAGKIAVVIGLCLVMIYMGLTYGFFGILADAALLVNIILILGALSALQATLTLPGIAGIVLTMGMAVDANVLVFERIREEIRKGQKIRASIEAGFQRAFSTIIDANLTTLFAALFLYIFGSGPIKGFAVTLSLGILTSMFTAMMITRLFISIWVERTRPKKLNL